MTCNNKAAPITKMQQLAPTKWADPPKYTHRRYSRRERRDGHAYQCSKY
jgi:hypothetical protein